MSKQEIATTMAKWAPNAAAQNTRRLIGAIVDYFFFGFPAGVGVGVSFTKLANALALSALVKEAIPTVCVLLPPPTVAFGDAAGVTSGDGVAATAAAAGDGVGKQTSSSPFSGPGLPST